MIFGKEGIISIPGRKGPLSLPRGEDGGCAMDGGLGTLRLAPGQGCCTAHVNSWLPT